MKSVLVVGAGLAGMTVAVRLAEAGCAVRVLEALPYVGGRTASWNEGGMPVETGLHRVLGFYTALPALLHTAGVQLDDIVSWDDTLELRLPDGTVHALTIAALRSPVRTLGTVFGHNDIIPLADKRALMKMFTAGLVDYKTRPDYLDTLTVAQYATHHGVGTRTIDTILTALTDGLFFTPVTEYSAYAFFGLFAPYGPALTDMRIGTFTGGMSKVLMQPLVDYVRHKKGYVMTDAVVTRLVMHDGTLTGVRTNDAVYEADAVVLALPIAAAQHLLRQAFPSSELFDDLMHVATMPAVTFQIDLRYPSMPTDRIAFGPGTILASFAEQSRTTFPGSGRLSVILSQPAKYMDVSAERLARFIMHDARKLNIDLRPQQIARYRKIVLPDDFYALRPGAEVLRPPQKTPVPRLYLAGDYTKQPFLATMEGAVVSGNLAAEAVLSQQ